jgi:hypothetical protein
MDLNWGLDEVQLAIDKVECLFFSTSESWLRMISQGPTYWRKASGTFEGCNRSCLTYQRACAWIYGWGCFLTLLDDTRAAMNAWGLRNRVACIEEPYSMHGTQHIAGFRCIHE